MRCFPQQGAELGERLLYAFRWCSQQGFQRTILIGSDTPHISRDIIDTAQHALNEVDIVLGPSDDGGYYLIGMRTPHDVFSGIPMSTSEVTERTIAAAHRLGLTVRQLETLLDVDEFSDLQRLALLLEKNSSLAPVTADHLTHMRLNA
jgi:rSAM/selenodomain-associated transferase 1